MMFCVEVPEGVWPTMTGIRDWKRGMLSLEKETMEVMYLVEAAGAGPDEEEEDVLAEVAVRHADLADGGGGELGEPALGQELVDAQHVQQPLHLRPLDLGTRGRREVGIRGRGAGTWRCRAGGRRCG